MRGGFNPPLIRFPRRYLRHRFKPLTFIVHLRKQPLLVQPFLYIFFVVFSLWQCVVYDSNFDLHLQLQYSKSNKEDVTMTYTISRRGSVPRLTDSNLVYVYRTVKIIALDKLFTMILSGYRPYTTSRNFCYKTYTFLL